MSSQINDRPPHSFHIPVLGTGFSLDTPLKVAKYGISSVISLVDDVLIEQVRKFYCKKTGEPYEEIKATATDARAKRITAYLNLVDKLVKRQVRELQASPFSKEGEITKYYEMLPESPLKNIYREMLNSTDPEKKAALQQTLREKAVPGSIDVNIMTKIDVVHYENGKAMPIEHNDAMSALRGYAESTLKSAIIFSAGINQYLYSYITQFKDFFSDKKNEIKKKIVLKVSDYRSAVTQGKFLAKKGLWVSEFRIESGLNCGGHAFATQGTVLGPIMEEFKKKKHELIDKLHTVYSKAMDSLSFPPLDEPHPTLITVQGGIATHEEDKFMREYYKVDGTGWGTPFLFVPEVVNIDEATLDKLVKADRNDVYLSNSSPVGIPFWNLRNSASEEGRRQRIAEGSPGAPCPKGYVCFNTEFTERPICTASKTYQKKKLEQLEKADLTPEQKEVHRQDVLAKSCICHELGGSTLINMGIDKNIKPSICPGPSIAYFSKPVKLDEMISHIYGRISLMASSERPHMFVEELRIYFKHLTDEIEKFKLELSSHTPQYLDEYKENLLDAISYYKDLAMEFVEEQREIFLDDLKAIQQQIEDMAPIMDLVTVSVDA